MDNEYYNILELINDNSIDISPELFQILYLHYLRRDSMHDLIKQLIYKEKREKKK